MAMAASFLLHSRKPPLLSSALPCRVSTVLLLGCLLLSFSYPISCTCSGSQPWRNLTVSGAFDHLPGYLFLTNMSTCRTKAESVDCRGLGSYMTTKYPAFDLSQKGWFFVRQRTILLRQDNYDDTRRDEASFSVVFTMSIYHHPNNNDQMKATNNGASLVFAVEPLLSQYRGILTPPNWQILGPSSSSNPSSSTDSAGGHLTAEIGTTRDNRMLMHHSDIIWVQIGIDPPPPAVNSSVAAASKYYSVWIDYDHVSHRMSVYIAAAAAGEDAPKPANPLASKNLTVRAQYALLGLFSTMGQLLQVHTWNSTVDVLPADFQDTGASTDWIIWWTVFILSFVLVSVAPIALVFLCLKSKYMRWKKEQDELTQIMQGIPGPGVPAHIDFTEIKKATKNFHESTKLGKGEFRAVYRCKLPRPPAVASGSLVAVKKFTREVKDHRCSDFITLQHKNIVPLVGWSYDNGEALLIYEYMTNGSLDQHLFIKQESVQQQQQEDEDTSLRQWDTRYGIARDIATGLHYVHHVHEPMVLHRDIKASNIMLDSNFCARLGDFCTVSGDRSSIAGTWGYIAPDYAMSYKATRQTDIYAFGVLVLEIVTGKKNIVPPDDDDGDGHRHITDWIWRLHGEEKLLDAVDKSILGRDADGFPNEARCLLLLGLACTDPNPLDRPTMSEVLQIITKDMPPPDVPHQKPAFVWPPRDWRSRHSVYSTAGTGTGSDWNRDGSLASTPEGGREGETLASRGTKPMTVE